MSNDVLIEQLDDEIERRAKAEATLSLVGLTTTIIDGIHADQVEALKAELTEMTQRVERAEKLLVAGGLAWALKRWNEENAMPPLSEMLTEQVEILRQRAERTEKKLAAEQYLLQQGTAELRRYVEGSGFEWCEEETTVFNVTTAIGLLMGEVEALKSKLNMEHGKRCAIWDDCSIFERDTGV